MSKVNWYRVLARRNDLRAIRKGPKAAAKREVRKTVHRHAHRTAQRILKIMGI